MKSCKPSDYNDFTYWLIDSQYSEIGFIVSKKYGNSVKRNLLKRRCRTLFYKFFINNKIKASLIVCPKKQNINYISVMNFFNFIYKQLNAKKTININY
tara:strand:- start:115 stop:408 length:294 start_codon:yes stop_codon:yes gene_type:complete